MRIVELETKNGRIFKVYIKDEDQYTRLQQVISDNKTRKYETFKRITTITKGVYPIEEFERLCNTLE